MEKGISDSDFVLCAFTPKGLERHRNSRMSGYAIELRNIFSRLEDASSDEEKLKFLIPVLMAGTKKASVPKELHHLLFIDAVTQPLGQFNFSIFLKEMWPLFESRFFKSHPRFGEIKGLLSKNAVNFGFRPSERTVLAGIPSLLPHVPEVVEGFYSEYGSKDNRYKLAMISSEELDARVTEFYRRVATEWSCDQLERKVNHMQKQVRGQSPASISSWFGDKPSEAEMLDEIREKLEVVEPILTIMKLRFPCIEDKKEVIKRLRDTVKDLQSCISDSEEDIGFALMNDYEVAYRPGLLDKGLDSIMDEILSDQPEISETSKRFKNVRWRTY